MICCAGPMWTRPSLSFWRYRLLSFGVTLLAVLLLVASLIAQIAIGAATEVITAYFHQLEGVLESTRLCRVSCPQSCSIAQFCSCL